MTIALLAMMALVAGVIVMRVISLTRRSSSLDGFARGTTSDDSSWIMSGPDSSDSSDCGSSDAGCDGGGGDGGGGGGD
jgi:hypothetical protein